MLPRGRALLIDVALAGALTIAALAEIAAGDIGAIGSRAFHVAVALPWTLSLLVRRRYPLATQAVVMAGLIVLALRRIEFFTTAQFVALMVAPYSVGAYAPRRKAIAALALTLLASLPHALLAAGGSPVGDVVYPLILLSAPWFAGRALHAWRTQAAELERLTVEVARLAVADERNRIARELHDAVAHSINVAIIQAEAAEELIDKRPDAVREPLRRIQSSGREALLEMRRMLGVLRQDDDVPTMSPPRVTDLPALVARVREAGLDVDLAIEGAPRDLSPGLDLNAYRIVQEALTNTLKHASAAKAWVRVRFGEHALVLEIEDDGAGGSPAQAETDGGHGHIGLRERALLFGGDVEAAPRRGGGGYLVRARLPLDREAT